MNLYQCEAYAKKNGFDSLKFEDDNNDKPTVKRGRGRPAGSKSGARTFRLIKKVA